MITYKGVKCYTSKIFPPKGYICITLISILVFRLANDEELKKYLATKNGRECFNHERIHMLQIKQLGWFKFYTYYLYFYLAYRIAGRMSHKEAYHAIPFEREAFSNEEDMDYSESHWEEYIYDEY